jgi:hypothetical protein
MATRKDLDMAFHSLTHHRPGVNPDGEDAYRGRRHFSVHELHDGSFLVEKDHGDAEPHKASARDLDEVHDHLESMMGTPNEGEERER